MDLEKFVRLHAGEESAGKFSEYDFAVTQYAWQELFGDKPVLDYAHMDQAEQAEVKKLIGAEVSRVREILYDQPEYKYYSDDYILDDRVEQKRDELIERGYDENLVDSIHKMDYGNLPFTLNGLRPEVLEHALKEWNKEIERIEILDIVKANRAERQGLEPVAPGESAELRAYKNLFSMRDKDLNELIPDLRDAELDRWEKEVEKQSPHREDIKRLMGEHKITPASADTHNLEEAREKLERFLEVGEYEEPKWKAFVRQHEEPDSQAYGNDIEFAIANLAWERLHGTRPVSDLTGMSADDRALLLRDLQLEINAFDEKLRDSEARQLNSLEREEQQEAFDLQRSAVSREDNTLSFAPPEDNRINMILFGDEQPNFELGELEKGFEVKFREAEERLEERSFSDRDRDDDLDMERGR